MRSILYSLLVLFFTCAAASTASAQDTRPLCPLFQAHKAKELGCNPNRDDYRADQAARANAFRTQEAYSAARERSERYRYGVATDHIRFGAHPTSRFGTLGGIPIGRANQWDHYNWGGYSSSIFFGSYWEGGSYHRDPDFAGGKYWVISYDRYGTECPASPPPNTAAPHNYEWRCEQGVDASWAAYVKKGRKQVLRDYAQRGIREGAIIV